MSVGSIVGGAVGGVIGFFASGGNPLGAAMGMSIGMGIGGLIDPVGIDSNIGAPEAQTITASSEGKHIAELLGTSKIQGNIIWYGNERTEEIVQEQQGAKGGGGGDSTVVGYNYFAGWALGLCMGEVDVLYSIWDRDESIWSGVLERSESGDPISITLDNSKGVAKIYWGTSTQEADTVMRDEALNYRNLCYIVFDDYSLGQISTIPSLSVIIKRRPPITGFGDNIYVSNGVNNQEFDYNPAAATYYIMNTMIGIGTDDLDLDSFISAATTLKTEGVGISMLINNTVPALTLQESILKHVDGHLSWGK